ncbi:hypothetical protein Trco_008365 [Trichoderma cornu-damae]|uniref:Uncharacterized protein n=1 Tax=Trichoderma cornu-damae TaxID=654480 RepID=A0A9P8QE02_9HYPO|nr:hypothetical protein Trco_008365 [Trichoderma cornu-damae]
MTMSPSPKPDDNEETSLMRECTCGGGKVRSVVLCALTLMLALALSKWAAATICLDNETGCLTAAEEGGGGPIRSDIESPLIGVRKTIP